MSKRRTPEIKDESREVYSRIFVNNPFTDEREEGTLYQNGAFVSDNAKNERTDHPTMLSSRVMVLGASSVTDFCWVGEGSVLHNAYAARALIGRNVTLDGSHVVGGNPFPKPKIGDGVSIGKGSSVHGGSYIGAGTSIGESVTVKSSTIGEGGVIESGSDGPNRPQTGFSGTARTWICDSILGNRVTVGSDAVVAGQHISSDNLISSESILHASLPGALQDQN